MVFPLTLASKSPWPEQGKTSIYNISSGSTIMEYGSGLGRFIVKTSRLAGPYGVVYAADQRTSSLFFSKLIIRRNKLDNVIPLLIKPYRISLPDKSLDLVFAFNVFHTINFTDLWLKEMHRLLKLDGTLIIENGRQSMKKARERIFETGIWDIVIENRNLLRCTPI